MLEAFRALLASEGGAAAASNVDLTLMLASCARLGHVPSYAWTEVRASICPASANAHFMMWYKFITNACPRGGASVRCVGLSLHHVSQLIPQFLARPEPMRLCDAPTQDIIECSCLQRLDSFSSKELTTVSGHEPLSSCSSVQVSLASWS